MTKDEFIQKVQNSLPIERKTDNFLEDVKNTYKRFIDDIKTIDDNVFKNIEDKTLVIQKVKERSDTILSVIKKYLDGCQEDASKLLRSSILNQDESLKIKTITINKGEYYYRIRKDDGTINSYQDMFHISNKRRDIIKTQRYSTLGFPCLYLGNTVYDCWEELDRPKLNELFISGFKVVDQFAVYDLRKPKLEDYETQNLSELLARLVFIIACQFKVYNKDGHFKPEYIIPQLILGLILSSNRKKKERECGPNSLAWGVAYTSTHLSNDCVYNENYLENLALPVVDTENEYCAFLTSLFMISDPICNRDDVIKGINANDTLDMKENTDKLKYTYNSTIFGRIEQSLKGNVKYNQSPYVYFCCPDNHYIPAEGGSASIIVKSNVAWNLSVDDINKDD